MSTDGSTSRNKLALAKFDRVKITHTEKSGWTVQIRHHVEAYLVMPGDNTPDKPGFYPGQLSLDGKSLLILKGEVSRTAIDLDIAVSRALCDAWENKWKKAESIRDWMQRKQL
jgi:hypothetical protein